MGLPATCRSLREARIRCGLTQADVGRAVGYTNGYIANIENGAANPTTEIVPAIEEFLTTDKKINKLERIVIECAIRWLASDDTDDWAVERAIEDLNSSVQALVKFRQSIKE